VSIGHPRVLRRFARALPKLERAAGGMLMVFGAGVLVAVGRRAVARFNVFNSLCQKFHLPDRFDIPYWFDHV
jgi:hypothetical protein